MIKGRVYITQNEELSFYNNTVKGRLYASENIDLEIKNNIINNSDDYLITLVDNTNLSSDYNCYYTEGNVFGKYYDPYWNNVSNLTDWQNIHGTDANSFYGNPEFLNDSNTITATVPTSFNVDLEVPAFVLNGHVVWGATAMMLGEVKDLLKQVL